MKLNSKHFDSLRAKPGSKAPPKVHACQWKGCTAEGAHKAPMGRGQENRYYLFCADHIRQYNANYNYFSGMSDNEIAAFQKDSLTGHRPTWKTGTQTPTHDARTRASRGAAGADAEGLNDPHGFFSWRAKRVADPAEAPKRYVKPLERKSLDALHLPETATKNDIKHRFKELVKRHHPDANGGDRGSEDRLREIIQAYNHLKSAGLA
jgi:curved DNA-binding protein CbpA